MTIITFLKNREIGQRNPLKSSFREVLANNLIRELYTKQVINITPVNFFTCQGRVFVQDVESRRFEIDWETNELIPMAEIPSEMIEDQITFKGSSLFIDQQLVHQFDRVINSVTPLKNGNCLIKFAPHKNLPQLGLYSPKDNSLIYFSMPVSNSPIVDIISNDDENFYLSTNKGEILTLNIKTGDSLLMHSSRNTIYNLHIEKNILHGVDQNNKYYFFDLSSNKLLSSLSLPDHHSVKLPKMYVNIQNKLQVWNFEPQLDQLLAAMKV